MDCRISLVLPRPVVGCMLPTYSNENWNSIPTAASRHPLPEGCAAHRGPRVRIAMYRSGRGVCRLAKADRFQKCRADSVGQAGDRTCDRGSLSRFKGSQARSGSADPALDLEVRSRCGSACPAGIGPPTPHHPSCRGHLCHCGRPSGLRLALGVDGLIQGPRFHSAPGRGSDGTTEAERTFVA